MTQREMWHQFVIDAEKVLSVTFQGVPMSIINVAGAGRWISDWASGGAGPGSIMGLLGSHKMNPNGFITEEHVRAYLTHKIGLSNAEMDEMA